MRAGRWNGRRCSRWMRAYGGRLRGTNSFWASHASQSIVCNRPTRESGSRKSHKTTLPKNIRILWRNRYVILAITECHAIITRMIPRRIQPIIRDRLDHLPAVALLGPRQVGKTTLALAIAEGRKSVYLDLESPLDREKLADAAFYLSEHEDELVILDEVQRVPELFSTLRGLIDQGRRRG